MIAVTTEAIKSDSYLRHQDKCMGMDGMVDHPLIHSLCLEPRLARCEPLSCCDSHVASCLFLFLFFVFVFVLWLWVWDYGCVCVQENWVSYTL